MTAAGGVSDELAKLLSAVEAWLRNSAGRAATPTPAAGGSPTAGEGASGPWAAADGPRVVRELFATAGAHRSDSPCQICPFCQLISAVRGVRPDIVEHLVDAAGSVLLAFRALTEAGQPAGATEEPQEPAAPLAPVVQHITVN